MKRKTVIKVTSLSALLGVCFASGITALWGINRELKAADAYTSSSLPTTIDLNDSTDDEIRAYYSSIDSLPESERQGKNLLKNLKPILKNGQKYYPYDNDSSKRIWKMYEIADRDWEKSPATEIPGYNASTNKITGYSYGSSKDNPGMNPYLHALYVDRSVDNKMHAWKTENNGDAHGGNKEWAIDREHIWPKSHGFENEAQGGARGDPMHLWPGDSGVNSALHSNYFYGYVNISDSGTTHGYTHTYTHDNYLGKSLTLGTSISNTNVFEPQDCDKGDIARAIFYMVARYNYLSGSDSDGIDANNPNLELVQSNNAPNTGYMSSTTTTGKMGIMTDLLNWHHLDPVDDWEIHRNNLLYKNYTNNRNPFIDYPQWVDYIWGTATYEGRNFVSYDFGPTNYADTSRDVINYGKDDVEVTKIEVTKMPNKTEYTVGDSFDKTGMVVTATYIDDTTADVTAKCSVTVDLTTAGEKQATISYKGKTAKITITVKEKQGLNIPLWAIIAAAAVVAVIIIVLICVGVLKVNKKGKIKVNKSGVKKIAKGSSKKKTKK